MLLGKGADVDKASSAGRSPLMAAARNGHTAAVRVLLGADARIWDESQGFPNVAGRLSRAAVVEMKRSIDALR
jgi:ankyrin repeat protein